MNKEILNEMGMGDMGIGDMGIGDMAMGDAPEMMASGALDEEEVIPNDLEDDLEDDMSVTCNKDELQEVLNAVEIGEKSAEEAFSQLCDEGGCMDDDMDVDMDVDMDIEDEVYDECMESVSRIASMLTEDPDVLEDLLEN